MWKKRKTKSRKHTTQKSWATWRSPKTKTRKKHTTSSPVELTEFAKDIRDTFPENNPPFLLHLTQEQKTRRDLDYGRTARELRQLRLAEMRQREYERYLETRRRNTERRRRRREAERKERGKKRPKNARKFATTRKTNAQQGGTKRKKRGGGWKTISDDANLETTVEILRQMIREHQRVKISSEYVYPVGKPRKPYTGTINRVWVANPNNPVSIGLTTPVGRGEYFTRPIKIELWEKPKRPKSAMKTGKDSKIKKKDALTIPGTQRGGSRKTYKTRRKSKYHKSKRRTK